MRTPIAGILTIALLICAGCDGSSPIGSHQTTRPLAGGGRLESDDPFNGGPGGSGPKTDDSTGIWPPDDPGYPFIDVLLSVDLDCTETPQREVIRDSAAWRAWWDSHNACLWRDCWQDSSGDGTIGDTIHPDTGWHNNCKVEPPVVDFEHETVVAISVEYDSGSSCMRSVWVTDIQSGASGTTITYDVTRLDSTCCMMIMAPMLARGTSPVIAVRVPHVISGEPAWVRRDTAYTCTWEPDPDEPLVLYYTDATCNLGGDEQAIIDSTRWAEWFHQTWACDSARWNYGRDSNGVTWPGDSTIIIFPGEDSVKPEPFPDPSYPYWIPNVDFSTHAILILRAGDQARWGGGIWLNDIARNGAGTTIDYTVVQPAEDCPPVEYFDSSVNPTVAIRVPLPIDPPVTWNRQIESIKCDWGSDSSWVGIDPNGGRP